MEHRSQATKICLDGCIRVVSDQASHAVTEPFAAQKPGAVERMEPTGDQVRRVPDIVQPRGRDKCIVKDLQARGDLSRPCGNPADMPPPTRPRLREKRLRQVTRPIELIHDVNLTGPTDTNGCLGLGWAVESELVSRDEVMILGRESGRGGRTMRGQQREIRSHRPRLDDVASTRPGTATISRT